jgi:heme-degrading monooxygenase HmoA
VTTIIINAITVPEGAGDELAKRFGARAGAVDDQDGFEGFELLRPKEAFQRGHAHAEGGDRPVSVSSEVWTYEVEDLPRPGGTA